MFGVPSPFLHCGCPPFCILGSHPLHFGVPPSVLPKGVPGGGYISPLTPSPPSLAFCPTPPMAIAALFPPAPTLGCPLGLPFSPGCLPHPKKLCPPLSPCCLEPNLLLCSGWGSILPWGGGHPSTPIFGGERAPPASPPLLVHKPSALPKKTPPHPPKKNPPPSRGWGGVQPSWQGAALPLSSSLPPSPPQKKRGPPPLTPFSSLQALLGDRGHGKQLGAPARTLGLTSPSICVAPLAAAPGFN